MFTGPRALYIDDPSAASASESEEEGREATRDRFVLFCATLGGRVGCVKCAFHLRVTLFSVVDKSSNIGEQLDDAMMSPEE